MALGLRKVTATATVVRAWPGQTRVPFLPPAKLAERRDRRVREIVTHAASSVPFYAAALREAGVEPVSIQGADDLARLPVIGKSLLQTRPDALRSTVVGDDDVVVLRTSGTTGQPVSVAHDRVSVLRLIAWSRRQTAVAREYGVRDFGGTILAVTNPDSAGSRVRGYFGDAIWRPGRPQRHVVSTRLAPADVLRRIDDLRPDVVAGSGSYVELLFRTAIAEGSLAHRPKLIRYFSDTFSEDGRRLVERELGVPVLAGYAAVEALRIGFACGHAEGFHIYEDLTHVEVVGEDGRLLPEGQHGELVLSNLVNRATVLLNYRIGDSGRIDRSACPCGRTTARIVDFVGRGSTPIVLPDGRVVFTIALHGCFKHRHEIARYRLIEDAPGTYRLLLRTAGRVSEPELVADVAPRVRAFLGGQDVAIAFDPTLGDGEAKFAPFVLLPRDV